METNQNEFCLLQLIPSLCFNYEGGGGSGNGSSRLLFQGDQNLFQHLFQGDQDLSESESDRVVSESERALTPAQKEEVAAIRGGCLTCLSEIKYK